MAQALDSIMTIPEGSADSRFATARIQLQSCRGDIRGHQRIVVEFSLLDQRHVHRISSLRKSGSLSFHQKSSRS